LPGTADTVSEVVQHFCPRVTPAKYDRVGNAPICRAFSDVPAGRVATLQIGIRRFDGGRRTPPNKLAHDEPDDDSNGSKPGLDGARPHPALLVLADGHRDGGLRLWRLRATRVRRGLLQYRHDGYQEILTDRVVMPARSSPSRFRISAMSA